MIRTMLCALISIAPACIDAPEEPTTRNDRAPSTDADHALLICGDNTVASVRAVNGNRVMFCVHDGVEIVAEGGAAEPLSRVDGTCALDVFLQLTDHTTPVPAALVRSCATLTSSTPVVTRMIVEGPVFATLPEDDVRSYIAQPWTGSFCASDGAYWFTWDVCNKYYTCVDSDCASWCKSALTTSSTKTMSSTYGEAGNVASSILASCSGATRFRGQRDRGSVDDSWKTMYDVDVSGGTAWRIDMFYDSFVYGDANFRFLGNSASGASHRYAGEFYDL